MTLTPLTPLTMILTVLSGVCSWTLAEYVLHRFLGHDRRTWPNPFADEHTRHHSQDYFAPTWKKALAASAAFIVVSLVAIAVLRSATLGVAFGVAFASMYVAYEVVHRRAHTHRGFGLYGRYLRRHHFHHHFMNPRSNHGVTSPLWDIVFGTWQRPGVVRVPRKLVLPWLIDAATGAVRDELAPFYEVVRPDGR